MRGLVLWAAVLMGASGGWAQEAMPGMAMGPQQGKPKAQPTMPGMKMGPAQAKPKPGVPNGPAPQAPMQMPGDMKMPAPGDAAAGRETESMRGSEAQQKGQLGVTPGPGSDAGSEQRDNRMLQEPEHPERHTGSDRPAPELLGDVGKRAPMGVEEFVAMAWERNPTIAEAEAEVRRAEALGRQAGLLPNPTVGYSGEHIRGGSYGGGEQGAYVQQEFVLGGKLRARRDVYRAEAGANQVGVEEQRVRVRNAVQASFYAALEAQAEVDLRRQLLGVAMDAEMTAHQLENVGQADAPDVLEAEAEAEQAKVDYAMAQRRYLQSFRVLAANAGNGELPVAPLKGDLEHPPVMDAEARMASVVDGSPSVKRARALVAVAEAQLKDAKREAVPNVTVRAGEWYSGEPVAPGVAAGPMSFVDAGVNVPLWNRNGGNIEAAKVGVERASAEVTRTELAVREGAAPLVEGYGSARMEADRYREELLPRARRAYELYRVKYGEMAAAYPQVLVSQRTLFQLQESYLRALGTEWATALALGNYLLDGGLEAPVGAGSDSTSVNLPTEGGE